MAGPGELRVKRLDAGARTVALPAVRVAIAAATASFAADAVCTAGTHIMLEWGDTFGPWEAGPEGCELYGFIAGEGSPFTGDQQLFDDLLAARGARMVPLPMPTRLPPWVMSKFASSKAVDWTTEDGKKY